MKYKWTYIYLQKKIFISIPLILIPMPLCVTFLSSFSFFNQREKLFALQPEAQGVTIPGGFWERKHTATAGKPLFAKEFNRSQNICYGLISFPGRNVQHCKANVRTSVYIGKLKGNQASSFSLNRNKSSFGAFGEKGEGGGLKRKREG